MERISRIEKEINEEILRNLKEKRTFINEIKVRRWKMVGHALRHSEELHNLIIVGMKERKRTVGRPENSYIG